MEVVTALLTITKHALGIYRTKEARKYLDRVLELEKLRYEESNKPEHQRNHALLDNIDHELCLIANATSRFGEPAAKD